MLLSEAFETTLPEGAEDPYVLKVVFMAGAGGTGKSKVAQSMFGGSLRYINQDKHLERFMKEAGEPLSRVGARYDLFKKAQNLKNKEVEHHGKKRAGIVIDVTGWEAKRVINPLNRFRALGYDVLMVFVRTSLETALDRNAARSRNVPDSFIRTAHAGSLKNMPKFRNAFGPQNFIIVDNDKDIDPKDWARHVAPKLHKIAMEFLSRPVKNPKGKAWLKQRGTIVPDAKPDDDDGAIDLSALAETEPVVAPTPVRVILPASL